ncbi:hypothetical protein A7D00_5592 [Trichophyton violaceum]|uniref:NmrA-like domain-containing protein n=1 Tax=Trichophyton violaceum TaxID=34388 RepID=A0A178FES6_TRIVO|nr:hypothetical protein A7D00_5592 [Trichophyton violaceum]
MSTSNNAVFVCGATGSQGGALALKLRKDLNWSVHSTVRNLTSPAAISLLEAGVKLTQGDWDNEAALMAALQGCNKIFLCLLPDFKDSDRERRQAEVIVKVAKAAGVKQVIVSTSLSVFTLDDHQLETEAREHLTPDSFMARHIASKKGVEDAVRNGCFDYWTILRPSFFMANFLEPKVARCPEPREHGTWTTAMTPEARLALIDHVDIAAFAVEAFREPQKFHGRAFGLASDILTVQKTLDVLGKAAAKPLKAIFMTDEEIREKQKTSNVFTNSQISMRYMTKYIDMDEITAVIQPTCFEEFLDREDKAVRKTYSPRNSA